MKHTGLLTCWESIAAFTLVFGDSNTPDILNLFTLLFAVKSRLGAKLKWKRTARKCTLTYFPLDCSVYFRVVRHLLTSGRNRKDVCSSTLKWSERQRQTDRYINRYNLNVFLSLYIITTIKKERMNIFIYLCYILFKHWSRKSDILIVSYVRVWRVSGSFHNQVNRLFQLSNDSVRKSLNPVM